MVNDAQARPRTAREATWGALVLAALLLGVLWRPIALFRTHTLAPADLSTQATSLTRIDGPHVVANDLLPDPVLQMDAWSLFEKGELAAGRAPLWNPYNAAGVPLLANYQAAPFSPFNAPFYVLPFKAALIVASFAKLFALALFTFLFLREIGCERFASIAGALAFATSGFGLLLHCYPHVGAMLALPGGLYFVERACAAIERGEKGRNTGLLVGLALVLGTAALAGHPETLGYGLLVLAGFCTWRMLPLFLRRPHERRHVARIALGLVLAGMVAAGLAAIQLLPFAEYLSRSSVLTVERGAHVSLQSTNWPLQFFPNLAGTPIDSRSLRADLPSPNYEEFTTFYVGGLVLFLTLTVVVFLRRERRLQFFALCGAVWVLYAWNVFGIATALKHVPLLGLVPIHRTQPLWVPSASLLAAWSLDRLSRAEFNRPKHVALAIAVAGAAFLAVFRFGAEQYLKQTELDLGVGRGTFPSVVLEHVTQLSIVFGIGVLAVAVLAWSRAPSIQRVASLVLLGALLAESGALLGNYVPAVEDRFVYPHTAATDELSKQVGNERLLMLTPDALRADTNMLYGLHMITNYDALGIADVDRLSEHFFSLGRDGGMTLRASTKALDLFGVQFVATKSAWIPIDTELGENFVTRYKSNVYLLSELTPERVPNVWANLGPHVVRHFEFGAMRDGLDAVCVQFADDAASRSLHVWVALTDASNGEDLIEPREFALAELPRLPDQRLELVLTFAPRSDSKNATYVLELRSRDATEAAAPRVVRAPKGRGYRDLDPAPEHKNDGGPTLDLAYGRRNFEARGTIGAFRLWRYATGALGRVVANAAVVKSHDEALALVESEAFDPRSTVVLEDGERASNAQAARDSQVQLIEELPGSQHWRVRSSGSGWFVLAQAFYPGWKARLDGAEVPLHRANYAFTALELPAGEHRITLDYQPASYRIGRTITFASIALVVAAALVAKLGRRQENRR